MLSVASGIAFGNVALGGSGRTQEREWLPKGILDSMGANQSLLYTSLGLQPEGNSRD